MTGCGRIAVIAALLRGPVGDRRAPQLPVRLALWLKLRQGASFAVSRQYSGRECLRHSRRHGWYDAPFGRLTRCRTPAAIERMVEEGADARTAYCSMFDAESCLVAASPFYACNKPLDLSAAAVTGRGGHSAALSSRAMSSVWRVAVSLAASRDARLPTVMPCHTCRRPRGRACAPSESVDFPFQELSFRVSKRTRAMIPSDRLSRISPDTA